MKLKGTILTTDVVVMIDPDATHNFISLVLVSKLNLPISPTEYFSVSLGTGGTVSGQGECRDMVLNLRVFELVDNFFPLDLGNSNVILGVQWLEKLGTVSTNWKLQIMQFN